ncbi:MAG: FkbM family methyltransferase [Pseudomonadota bacterium]
MLRALGRDMVNHYLMGGDEADFAKRKSRFDKLRGHNRSVEWDSSRELFKVTDTESSIYVARKHRVRLMNRGIVTRQKKLLTQYLGDNFLIEEGDAVIDCGANVGEFSLACAQLGARVYAFEPDPVEFRALQANASATVTSVNKALWHTDETLTFYDNNDSGDSSLIDTGSASQTLQVEAIRLDSFAASQGLDQVALIKLEAEGAEPEVLEGARGVLSKTLNVAVDMGPERGVSQENTVTQVTNRLTDAGFKLRHFDSDRICGLFSKL